jgi:radical SAM protein with 4Fe4S-binding SPASM domain
LSDDDTLTPAIVAVERWLGNPVTRTLLKLVAGDDRCGNRLENALDRYVGIDKDLCWKCRMASGIIGFTINRAGNMFGLDEPVIRAGLMEPAFRRGLSNVLRGISLYGVSRPQIINAPFLVVWDFTHMCNLRCKHCYQDAQKALPDELTTDESKRLIEELARAGVAVIAFSGGEPLMRKDLFEVTSHAKKQGMYVSIASNGTLITPEMASRIHEAGVDYIEISIDGKDAAAHDGMRGIPGAFDRSVAGIRNCVDAGIYTCMATTITRDNYDQIPEMYALAQDLRIKRWMCFNFIPTGRGVDMSEKDITPRQRDDLLKFILDKDKSGTYPVALSTAPQLARVAVEYSERGDIPIGHFHTGEGMTGKTRMLADFIGGCGAGRLYCSIEPAGDVQPCVFIPIPVGNIRQKSFLDIWHNAPVLLQLRDRSKLKAECGSCNNKYICGGCRARAWAYYGDLDAPDPGCVNNQQSWERIVGKRSMPKVDVAPPAPPAEHPVLNTPIFQESFCIDADMH